MPLPPLATPAASLPPPMLASRIPRPASGRCTPSPQGEDMQHMPYSISLSWLQSPKGTVLGTLQLCHCLYCKLCAACFQDLYQHVGASWGPARYQHWSIAGWQAGGA
jgi:hypothetical protein